ncbi:uncharacterized protein LOC114525188 [Dendronephthya gigantea]|uniref:uncharacterized protein LOC114525188 n=1 Tax=Dendronephthya gigantea TaxID=151771 RepID=UPI00106D92B1|nr:uncharacterized protein LOC114525188 [Dendronephthya gigantea]
MALCWNVFASLLIAYCVASAAIDKGNHISNQVENRVTPEYKTDKKPEPTSQVGKNRAFCTQCQMGTVGQDCWPNSDLCRTQRFHVNFTQSFEEAPSVIVSLHNLDVDQNFNLRVNGIAVNITSSGFDLWHRAWADTKIYGLGYSWIACPN